MKLVTVACLLTMTGLFSSALAVAAPAQGSGQFGQGQSQNLDTIKQRIEQRIAEHITRMQSIQTCVQNAQDRQALHQCLPRRRGHRHGQFGTGQPQQQGQ